VAVVTLPPEEARRTSLLAADDDAVLVIEPERIVYALEGAWSNGGIGVGLAPTPGLTPTPVATMPTLAGSAGGLNLDFLLGYQQAVNHLVEHLIGGRSTLPGAAGATLASLAVDESQLTWGLQATRVPESSFSGKGVKIAVLDTGLDLGHPDFVGRQITPRSFISGEDVQDGHGHGTHCIGTACGPKQPGQLPRYGCAYESEIFAGKVLSNRGSGSDGGILAGIDWAIRNGCAIISMSLGAATMQGQSFSRVFETVARRALNQGTLIVAAAGNESSRPSLIAPVGHPANCPSILSVAALDQRLLVASFSCGGINPQGGQVDIAGPGVAVRSTWPRPTLYRTISGTSMATPHVAGIAALHAQANPDMRGGSLGWLLLQSSRRLDLQARDAGVGLVQALVA
jgi:hypothetical protein